MQDAQVCLMSKDWLSPVASRLACRARGYLWLAFLVMLVPLALLALLALLSTSFYLSAEYSHLSSTHAPVKLQEVVGYTIATNAATSAATNAATSTTNSGTSTASKTTNSASSDGGSSVYGNASIMLANGTTVLASQVRAGTVVLGYNLLTGKLEPTVISSVIKRGSNNVYVFNGELHVDANEVMFIDGRWAQASTARVGDTLFDPLTGRSVTINSISIYPINDGVVYDFVGSPVNNYIADGYLIDAFTTTGSVSGGGQALLANGQTEAISSLTPGTVLMGYDPSTGSLVPDVLIGMYPRHVTQIIVINDGQLVVDGGQDMYVNGTLQYASSLKVGDELYSPVSGANIKVTNLIYLNGSFTLYDTFTTPTSFIIVNGYVIGS